VRRLLPITDPPGATVDPVDEVWARDRTPPPGRPWVLANMISSADGGASLGGTSGALGGEADKAMFAALREVPDVILVAAGTVRAEAYRPIRPKPEVRERRRAHGRAEVARLAIVTSRIDLDLADPLFTDTEVPPLVITGAGAPPERAAAAEAAGAELLVAGDARVDLPAAVVELGRRGASTVLCEGGPSLLGQLVAADLLDELDLTLAPSVVGGDAPRIAHGPGSPELRSLALHAACEQDGVLLLTYLRTR
jgi:5-amino-6-(5-phosphoribosylamino)uracil reductase